MSESNVLQFQILKENHEQASAFNEALGFKLHDSLASEFVWLSNRINRTKKRVYQNWRTSPILIHPVTVCIALITETATE